MAEVTIIIKADSPAEVMAVKNSLQIIGSNFNKENLKKIADLSNIPNANERIKDLFNNQLFKMALR